MSAAVICLVLFSTFTHAGWNLLARGQKDEMAFFTRMLLIIMAVGLVPVAISESIAHSLPLTAWLCLAGSGVCGGIYLFGLARAYGASDFTVVYPVARALPVLLIALTDMLRGRFLTGPSFAGLILVAAGCLLTPLTSFGKFSIKQYFHRSILWILLAASGTVGYSTFDKIASEIVLAGPATAVRYCYVFFALSGVVLLLLQRINGIESWKSKTVGWKMPACGAVCFFGSYVLVLWAYQMTDHASYVVAFRQFSIIVGVLAAVWLYKERTSLVRVMGIALIMAGLVLVALLSG